MIDPAADAVWDGFLRAWPVSRLSSMTLPQYTEAGGQDTLVYWLESKTEMLGSIWGGSAFKFGIFSRGNTESKLSVGHLSYDDRYGWYTKYGASSQEAFTTVKDFIERIAQAAMQSDLAAIEAIAFSPAVKWKIAFLYQPRAAAVIVPIFTRAKLVAYLEHGGMQTTDAIPQAELYRQVRGLSPGNEILEFGAQVLAVSEQQIAGKGLSTRAAEEFLKERYGYRRAPTQGVAGFENDDGRQLALVKGSRRVKVFLQPPLPALVGLGEAQVYPPERMRTIHLDAQTPLLANGESAVLVSVPDMATLERLCDLYDAIDEAQPATKPSLVTVDVPPLPLNLVLYGPPGTGKTHATVVKALEAIDPIFVAEHRANRSQLTERFRQLQAMGRIQFVTFHQSFSYEDFVEGIRATRDEKGQLAYTVEDGVFKKLCIAAAAKVTQTTETALNVSGRTIWKMSLGNTQGEDAYIFNECVARGVALLGYGDGIDFTGCKTREDVRKRQLEAGLQPSTTDYSTTAVNLFAGVMKPGDLIVVSDGNHKFRAIGEVKEDYKHVDRGGRDDYAQSRAVIWHRVYEPSLPAEQLMMRVFSQMTLYELRSESIDLGKLRVLLGNAPAERRAAMFSPGEIVAGYKVLEITPEVLYLRKPNGKTLPFDWRMLNELAEYVRTNKITYEDIRERRALEKVPQSTLEPYIVHGYQNILPKLIERILLGGISEKGVVTERKDAWVLIIDEINRGNISRIFGELITLIEPSRREGAQEAVSAQLPYSRDMFSVPPNVYLIGTMNTADRSLAGLDIALRRRFRFEEMPPEPDHLTSVTVESVPIDMLMTVLNGRIEALRDSDHCLGHSFFLPLLADPSLKRLSAIFRGEILPLLEEYFFEDWERIRWVLNDHAKPRAFQFVVRHENTLDDLFGNDIASQLQDRRWTLNDEAFESIESYKGILRP